MFLAAQDLLNLLPNLRASAHRLHEVLVPASFGVCVAGVTLYGAHAKLTKSLAVVFPMLVKLMIVSVMVGAVGLGSWGNAFNAMAREVVSWMGINAEGANPGNAYGALQNAIQGKWGTRAAQPSTPSPGIPAQGQPANNVDPFTGGGPNLGGAHLTTYGYEKPGERTYDSQSAAGIGAFSPAPGSLVAGRSLAISDDLAQRYNLTPGETVRYTGTDGRTYEGIYADKPAKEFEGRPLTGIIDVYDPTHSLGSLEGVQITNVNGMGVPASGGTNGGGVTGILRNLADATMLALAGPFIYVVSLAAAVIMWLMVSVVQPVLFLCEVAISPLFISMLMVPSLVTIASRFLLSFVALCLWPLGFAVADLITRALVDAAVNPTNSLGQFALNATGAPWAIWIAVAVWVTVGYFFAPLIFTAAFIGGGGSGLSTLIGASFLAASNALRPGSMVQRSVGAAAGAAGSIATRASGSAGGSLSNGSSALPALPLNNARTGRGNYAARPAARRRP